jgi:UDP-glucose 4-epimerase
VNDPEYRRIFGAQAPHPTPRNPHPTTAISGGPRDLAARILRSSLTHDEWAPLRSPAPDHYLAHLATEYLAAIRDRSSDEHFSPVTRLLVTGGAGFIGSHLVQRLVRDGREVRVLDDLSTGTRANLAGISGSLEVMVGDVRDADAVRRAVAGTDAVFHLAALPSVQRSWDSPLDSLGVNALGTANVVEAAVREGCRAVVYSSSSSVYGEQAEPVKVETLPPRPISPYGYAKLMGEKVALAHSREDATRIVALRYFNVFGPRQDPDSPYAAVVPLFIRHALAGTVATVHGDGLQRRDFTYVGNAVRANLAALHAAAHGVAVNVACGRSVSVLQLVQNIDALLGRPLRTVCGPARPGDIRDSLADLTRARQVLGYEAPIGFEEGLRLTCEWYASRHGVVAERPS